ncbi:MAG: translation initiation factor eIF-2B [Ignavibacteria bacterium]|nr:translation initiation factor eIF-2B [Ignavibacteria bacterium]
MVKKTNQLSSLINDKTSGSSEILFELNRHLKSQKKSIQLFPEIIETIRSQFLSFQNVITYINKMEAHLKKNKNLDIFFNEFEEIYNNTDKNIYSKCSPLISRYNTFITISNSKTVFEILIFIKKENPKLHVIVCESRPIFEGRKLAKILHLGKVSTELITEASIYDNVKKSDCCLIGADALLKNGDVINKVGSATLALVCRYFKKPLFVIASKDKKSKSNTFKQKKMPPNEIWQHYPNGVKINNFYFERIPKKLITKIIFV